ncbi:MAG TPA: hypothetical protein ENH40_01485 [Nitrospirae bacterium]|nr:hypothetical protein [Nitrospirota bacterium]
MKKATRKKKKPAPIVKKNPSKSRQTNKSPSSVTAIYASQNKIKDPLIIIGIREYARRNLTVLLRTLMIFKV